jgi:hypothetical protein
MTMSRINIFLVLLVICTGTGYSQTIQVDARNVIRVFNHHPVGINVNYLMDDDAYLKPEIPIAQALITMKVGMLRYPGGEKSDNYLWSIPPYESANPHFATRGNCNWPNGDNRFSSNAINPKPYTLDFDEFMELCEAVGAEPLIVVSGDAHLCDVCPVAPTLDTLIRNAVEWIRYANVKNHYDIKYWVVGNESYHSSAYGSPGTAIQYAHDFIRFSKSMKAVDSSICIVGNTRSGDWVNTLLNVAEGHINALAVSNYPIWDWKNGYDVYRTGNPGFVSDIQSVINSIGVRDLKLFVTEYGPIDWSGSWPMNNDLGHALVSFQMFGDIIKLEKVQDAYLWNTRWVDNNKSPRQVYDAIDADGHLNATGKALSMWGKYLLDKLVYSNNGGYIRSFASVDSSDTRMNIYLINKDYESHHVELKINNWPGINNPDLAVSEQFLSGTSSTDEFPVISEPAVPAQLMGSTLIVGVNPLSVHVICLNADPGTGLPDDFLKSTGMRIYPNPFTSVLNIWFEKPLSKPCEMKISNIMGMEIRKMRLIDQNTQICLDELPEGFYILSLGNKNGIIIKQ